MKGQMLFPKIKSCFCCNPDKNGLALIDFRRGIPYCSAGVILSGSLDSSMVEQGWAAPKHQRATLSWFLSQHLGALTYKMCKDNFLNTIQRLETTKC